MAIIYSEFHHEEAARERAAERERPVKLFFRFHNKEERDAAVRQMEGDREFTDAFAQMVDYRPDPSAEHGDDGLALRFREYDRGLLEKVKGYFNEKAGREVVMGCNEWIVEADEQERELQERIDGELKRSPEALKKPAEVIPIRPPEEEEPKEAWREKKAA